LAILELLIEVTTIEAIEYLFEAYLIGFVAFILTTEIFLVTI